MRGPPHIIQGVNLVAPRQHLAKLTEVEAGGQAGTVPQDLQVDVLAPVSFPKQASSPVKNSLLSDLA